MLMQKEFIGKDDVKSKTINKKINVSYDVKPTTIINKK